MPAPPLDASRFLPSQPSCEVPVTPDATKVSSVGPPRSLQGPLNGHLDRDPDRYPPTTLRQDFPPELPPPLERLKQPAVRPGNVRPLSRLLVPASCRAL